MNRVIPALLASSMMAGMASAQTPPRGDKLQRDPYITSSGATVDKPGVPQASGPTKLDRKIQRQDNKIDKGICNGC